MGIAPAFISLLVILGVSADDNTQWNLIKTDSFACDATKVEGLYYDADNFYGPDRGQGAAEGVNSLDDCMNRCFLNPKCLSVNHRKIDSFCEYHMTKITDDINESFNANRAWADADWDHYRIDGCPEEASPSPVGCGKQASAFRPSFTRIIGGAQAKSHSWPWQTALTATNEFGNSWTCGASLIRVKDNVEESDILLTASHCVFWWRKMDPISNVETPYAFTPEQVTAFLGFDNRDKFERGSQVRVGGQIVSHPDYDADTLNNDIALIRLSKPVKFSMQIRPICLPKQNETVATGRACAAAGWGRTNATDQSSTSSVLKEVAVTIQDTNECANRFTKQEELRVDEDQMICAKNPSGTDGTCKGDSGGMLACKDDIDGKWVLQGATSWGTPTCLKESKPEVFARISHYVDWIEETAANMNAVKSTP